MEKITVKKIIAGVGILGIMVGGVFVIDRATQKDEIKQINTELVRKSENKTMSYSEYLQLIKEYNNLIKEKKDKGEKLILKDINKNNTIKNRLDDLICQ